MTEEGLTPKMTTETPDPRGVVATAEVLQLLDRNDGRHGQFNCCPGCGADMMRVGLPDTATIFEMCTCDAATYVHLVERLAHRRCLDRRAAARTLVGLADEMHRRGDPRELVWWVRERAMSQEG